MSHCTGFRGKTLFQKTSFSNLKISRRFKIYLQNFLVNEPVQWFVKTESIC